MFNFRKTVKKYWFPILIIFIVILNTIVWLPKYGVWSGATDLEYQIIAENILNGEGFSLKGEKTMFREPVYPFFLFLNYKLFGINKNIIRFEQFVLLFLVCFLVYKISKKYFNKSVARMSVLMIVLHPVFLIYATDISSEILAVFLIVLFCWVFLESLSSEKNYLAFFSGLTLALLVLVKSIFIILPLLVIVFNFLVLRRKSFLKTLLFVFGFVLILSPWLLRNQTLFDTWSVAERGGLVAYVHASKSELSGKDLKNYATSAILSQYFVRLNDPSFDVFNVNIKPINERKADLLEEGFSEREVDIQLAKDAKELWLEHPIKNFFIGFLELSKANSPVVPKNSIMFVYDVEGSKFSRFLKGSVILGIRLAWLMVLGLMIYGIYKSFKFKKYSILFCVFLIFYLNGIIFFLEGVPRFLLPIYPLYFIFFSFGLYCLLDSKLKISLKVDNKKEALDVFSEI